MALRRSALLVAALFLPCWCFAEDCPVDGQTGPFTEIDPNQQCNSTVSARHGLHSGGGNSDGPKCTLFMAKSTIPGAGLGIFSGVDRDAGEIIGNGDVMIPVPDVWLHLTALGKSIKKRNDYWHINPLGDYVWIGTDLGMHRESSYTHVNDTEYIWGHAPGLDAAINCHLGLNNVEKGHPDFSVEGLHRSKDPGAGAFTPYYGCQTTATHPIPAGGELFKDYGDDWFLTRTRNLGLVPLAGHYAYAEKLLKQLFNMLERRSVAEVVRKDLWELIHHLAWEETRAMNAIPRGYENLELVARHGIRAAYQPQAIRDLIDLELHGRCMDNIRAETSTIRQAGRGAFATRFLAKDKIITGTPLLFFPSREYFDMYAGDWFHKEWIDESTHAGYQLLLNYCWHHNTSSIYLCPYGGGINYINHNKTRANVRLQWAPHGQMGHNGMLLRQRPAAMYLQAAPKLYMDVVALRDIQSGEELFLDYGDEWEQAWIDHVETWPAEYAQSSYISPRDWNRDNRRAVLRTQEEQVHEPYSANFDLYCLPEILDSEGSSIFEASVVEPLWKFTTVGYPCRIVERKERDGGDYLYKVEYINTTVHDTRIESEEWSLSNWIIREAMRFEDVPYTTDQFLPRAFRYPVGISDEIFPHVWREAFLPPLPARTFADVFELARQDLRYVLKRLFFYKQ